MIADSPGASKADSHRHYFSSQPLKSPEVQPLRIALDGHELDLVTAPGVFSPTRLDLGTRVLLRKTPTPPQRGNLLDIGCGWGPIALTLAMRAPQATIWAIDINERARELTKENVRRTRLNNVRVCSPQEVPSDVEFSTIWSNLPVRIGKPALQDLTMTWLQRLSKDGDAWLVMQRNLGADSFHRWLERVWNVERIGSSKGFRVLQVRRKDGKFSL